MSKVTISLEELNDKCKEEGLKPFPIRSFTFDSDSDKHFELSVQSFAKQVEEWIWQQHNIKREVFAGLVREVVSFWKKLSFSNHGDFKDRWVFLILHRYGCIIC